eukprot:TRINITY_DN43_c0_g1_i1.p1 TRINITY_DN43_c0_g1~~TRINITY_DN43_c0_g1_i1.p1  ORF type:complete len:381 (+),score=69.37 TRINITY_DN43_c0_g1_i1:246-1388(+)
MSIPLPPPPPAKRDPVTPLIEDLYSHSNRNRILKKAENQTQFLTGSELYSSIKHTYNLIIIDLRSPESFSASHIFQSVNLDITSFAEQSREEKYFPLSVPLMVSYITKKANMQNCHLVFVLGENTQPQDGAEEKPEAPKQEKLIEQIKENFGNIEYVAEICYLEDYLSFERAYKFLCVSSGVELSKMHLNEYPSEIIPGFLYLGSYMEISKKESLQKLGIGHILNVATECSDRHFKYFVYNKREIVDRPEVDISLHFDEAFSCIERAREEKSAIVIHCLAGISRSASITIAYLMKTNKWDTKTAINHVKSCRPFIQPNRGFTKVLLDYGEYLKNGGYDVPITIKREKELSLSGIVKQFATKVGLIAQESDSKSKEEPSQQ